jgi:hypothetical protein
MIFCPYCEPVVSGWIALACVDCTELMMELSMASPDPNAEPRLANPDDPLSKLLLGGV